jgi:hypothetical protein
MFGNTKDCVVMSGVQPIARLKWADRRFTSLQIQ